MSIYVLILVIGLVAAIFIYNRLVKLRNRVEEAWSGIDVQLKRRHNLVPSLVEIVKGYAQHESQVFEEVTRLRSESKQACNHTAIGQKEGALSKGIKGVMLLAEAYPDLKATDNFQQLSSQLVEIEDTLQKARRYYNGAVRDLNIEVETFPSVLVAKPFNFTLVDYFEIELATERSNPEVNLDAS